MRKFYIVGLVVIACLIIGLAYAEQITFSTYYPAPFGVYREMRTIRHAIGDTYYKAGDHPWDEDGFPISGEIDQDADLVVEGNVGIGTIMPRAKLELDNDGAILAAGTYGSGWTVPNLSTGTRMLWYPRKAAFRVGYVDALQWNDPSIGSYSVAMGRSTIASGDYSSAIGGGNQATGNYSVAMGRDNYATGENSVALGYQARADGYSSVAIGFAANASAAYSMAMGRNALASGAYSFAVGDHTTAEAYNSLAIGRYNTAGGTVNSWVDTDPIFEIGIGADEFNKANALTVLKKGSVGIGTAEPLGKLHIKGGRVDIENTGSQSTLRLLREETFPQDNDSLGDLVFTGRDSAGNLRPYAYIRGVSEDVTDGSEDGRLDFLVVNIPSGYRTPLSLRSDGSIWQQTTKIHPDYVFAPEYQLETIEEHGEFMWREKYLPAVPKAEIDKNGQEMLEIATHRNGILEELEKAHIYIEQLNERIKILEAEIE